MERSCATKYEAVLPVLALLCSIPSYCSQFLRLLVTRQTNFPHLGVCTKFLVRLVTKRGRCSKLKSVGCHALSGYFAGAQQESRPH
jgi:hypothetical protein